MPSTTSTRLPPVSERLLALADNAVKTLAGGLHAARPLPAAPAAASGALEPAERMLSGRLMRVNHVGEICAQALYQGQALVTRDAELRRHFIDAARDECDHLAWCETRLQQLGSRPSLLNPLWYGGALLLGALAGKLAGDKASLGFVIETENQVEQHLAEHLQRLPDADQASRAVVAQMKDDEIAHARAAADRGGVTLPLPVRLAMRAAARVMTTTAHWV